jgi:hypothetical protein
VGVGVGVGAGVGAGLGAGVTELAAELYALDDAFLVCSHALLKLSQNPPFIVLCLRVIYIII